tara:strand:- start:631 stop:1734 length:1104 start_codon:yes stop_codon:yes gene_type:complete
MTKHSNNIFLSDGKLLTQEAKLNVLSCFDGMSCLRIALEELGIPINKYFASEIDKYAMTVANALFEDTIQVGSVEFVTKEMINHRIDLLAGGSPCQGFSFAGKQLNFEDPRSKLFFEFVRLKNELKPKYFFLENVKMKKEHQDVISKYMGCEPIIVNSALVSAQNRVRLYWTNLPNFTQPKDEGIVIKDITVDGSDKIGAMRGRYIVDGKRQDYKMKTAGMTTQRIELRKDEKSNCITTVAKDNYLVKLFNTNPSGKGMNGWVYHTDYKSPTVTTNKGEGNKISHDGIWYRKLLPIECGRLQTIPEHILEKMLNCGVSNSQLYKMFGNGWTIKVVTHFLKGMSEKKEGKKKILLRADTHEPLIETGT